MGMVLRSDSVYFEAKGIEIAFFWQELSALLTCKVQTNNVIKHGIKGLQTYSRTSKIVAS